MQPVLQHFAIWLSATPISLFIQNVLWIIPAVQCVHIVAIAVVLSSVAMIDLQIFGMAGRRTPMSETADRYLPWIWGALGVLAITGVTLITGEPVRSLTNPSFQLKMLMLLAAIVVTGVFQVTVRRQAGIWDRSANAPSALKIAALATLLLWFAIAVAGRWIAYMVLDYAA